MPQTSSINTLDTKKLDAMESELKQLNTLTPSEIITRMNQLYEKYSAEYQADKEKMSPELRAKYEKLLMAMKWDIAEIGTKVNGSGKEKVHMQTLDALRNFQPVTTSTQSVEKPAESIAVAEKAPETFSVNMDSASAEALKKFQKSAAEAFKAEVLGSDGKPDYLSLRKGLELVSSLEELQNIDMKVFDTLNDTEKEKLKEQLPAVRGIIGAIFVESLFADGYTLAFNGDGTVNMRAKSGISDVHQKMSEINTAIKRDSTLSQTLKMGLLYADGDLLKYMQSVATSDGNDITPEMQTPGEFLKYLNNRDQNTLAGDAIKSSANFFENINLPEQMKAANHIPEIGNTLSVVMQDPNVMAEFERAAAEAAAKQQGIYNAPSIEPMSKMEAGTQAIKGVIGDEWQTKSIDQSVAEHGVIIGGVEQALFMVGRWAESLSKSPAALWVAILVFFYSWFGLKNGLLKSLAYGALGLGVMGWWDYLQGKYDRKEWVENSPIQYAPSPIPTADPDVIQKEREQDFGVEWAKQATEIMDGTLASANNNDVLLYLEGDKSINLTSEQKALLDVKENADIAKKEIEDNRKRVFDRIGSLANADNADAIKEMQEELLWTLTVEKLKNLANLSDAELQKWSDSEIAKIEQALAAAAAAGTISPEEKKAWDEAIAWLKAAAVKWGLLFLGTVVAWKGFKYALIWIAKGIGGKIWEAIINKVQKASISNAVMNAFRKKDSNENNETSDSDKKKKSDNTKKSTADASKSKTPEDISNKHADISDAVNNAEIKINGQDVMMDANGIKHHNEFREKLQKLSADPGNTALRTEVQKAFNNFYDSVDPDGKIITKDIRMQIADDIMNSKVKLPTSVDDFFKMLVEARMKK